MWHSKCTGAASGRKASPAASMPTAVAGLAMPTPWPASANWQTVLEYGVSMLMRSACPDCRNKASSRLRDASSAFNAITSASASCANSTCSNRVSVWSLGNTATAWRLARRWPRSPSSSDSSATAARSSSPDTTMSRKVLESRICRYSGVSG